MDKKELKTKIKAIDINPKAWKGVCTPLRKIVENILVKNPKARPRAKDLVEHPYFMRRSESISNDNPRKKHKLHSSRFRKKK